MKINAKPTITTTTTTAKTTTTSDEIVEMIYAPNTVDRFLLSGSYSESFCQQTFKALFVKKWSASVECQCAASETFIALNGEVPTCQAEDGSKNIFGRLQK